MGAAWVRFSRAIRQHSKETSFAPNAADRPVVNLTGETSRRPAELPGGRWTWSQQVTDLGLSAVTKDPLVSVSAAGAGRAEVAMVG